jgi:hypothetical protein
MLFFYSRTYGNEYDLSIHNTEKLMRYVIILKMHSNNVTNILQLDGYHEEYPSATSSSQCENLRLLVLFANPHLAPDVILNLIS